ncbi:hypothetical protein Gbfr_022_039 [Gluconobacter frateurii M-2]|nr:hypothetical protein Gbfr_022_039 [Gluconobacter frateurii M-2]
MADKAVHIEGRALAFVSYGVDRKCAREYLRGIRVEYHEGRAVCIATDGAMMLYARSNFLRTEPFEAFTLDWQTTARLVHICRQSDVRSISFDVDPACDRAPGIQWFVWEALDHTGTSLERGFVSALSTEHRFPNWRHTLAGMALAEVCLTLDIATNLLARASHAVRSYVKQGNFPVLITAQPNGLPAILEIPGFLDAGGVIMPNRGGKHGVDHSYTIPEWAMPAAEETAA